MEVGDQSGGSSRRSVKSPRVRAKRDTGLTPREREIAALVAKGFTNRSIAQQLVISERTAEFHVEQIMNKLGFHSRAEVAAWVAQRSVLDVGEREPTSAVDEVKTPAAQTAPTRWRVPALATLAGLIALAVVLAFAWWPRGSAISIQTIAGSGLRGTSDDVRTPTAADLTLVPGMAIDPADDLYFVDGHRVRELTSNGKLMTIAGAADPGYSGDGGPAIAARLNAPQGLAIGSDGSLYIADMLNNCIRKVDQQGVISTVAGTAQAGYSGDGGPAALAQLNSPVGVAAGFGRVVYIADSANHRVRRIGSDGVIVTVAGTGELGYAGDAGPATSAPVGWPTGLAFDHKGNLYIADAFNDRVRKLDLSGTITTVAGTGIRGYSGDQTRASLAQLSLAPGPPRSAGQALAVDTEGNLYIADTANQRVRRVSVGGQITTVAGTGKAGYSGDGGPASAAELNGPLALAVDADDTLFIADTENNRIRKLNDASR
ncbi:MAG TPA: LuxR C-terminal-related transcriptional regulator [Chloroflexota bacterium]|nr:LuxR C-terminal-related transcriptional regulator [Chloroflexota bacterium]